MDAGNTVIVIEHDLDVVKRADWVIDLGPDGGRHGGEIVFAGTPAALLDAPSSVTAESLRRALSTQGGGPARPRRARLTDECA